MFRQVQTGNVPYSYRDFSCIYLYFNIMKYMKVRRSNRVDCVNPTPPPHLIKLGSNEEWVPMYSTLYELIHKTATKVNLATYKE